MSGLNGEQSDISGVLGGLVGLQSGIFGLNGGQSNFYGLLGGLDGPKFVFFLV